ncbi:DEAD/DEAH box helicase [Flintibacter muris]|uniref:DEAD/DEAH box helicase n=1 Tax=Flintibacter muris TaxID=2941327 RepID=UPI00203CCC6D|nr:DEAD/DEAH box helicase [Flintibacter muris]
MQFRDLGLNAPILKALAEQGYTKPSPIQEKAIPPALAGRDVLGCAQTGTGKTCAFATPILQRLEGNTGSRRSIRALILTPTRELAIQIGESFDAYGKYLSLRHAVIFGGVGQNPQVEALKRGVDILVATPGRLMDLHDQGFVSLDALEIFVLDEADRMLDMGFIHDVRKILKWLPQRKQTLFFSATMPPEITDLVNSLLKNPVKVAVDPISSPVEVIRQSVYLVDKGNKTSLLAYLMEEKRVKNALVFTRTKHGANKVARDLGKAGISAAAIHGNKSQTARQQALADFKSGRVRCLVATDIAARGLDIEELSHVFNYNLPEVPETYVHRIGRTGRAGRGGEAIAFCDFGEKPLLKDIERLTGKKVPLVEGHPFPMRVFEAPKRDKNGKIINEEDAEARAAARELRRQREEARKAAEQAGLEAARAQTVPEEGAQSGGKKKRRHKKKVAAPTGDVTLCPSAPKAEEDALDYLPAPPKRGVRPGALLDTGDSMPNTEFRRPNPLDSDTIMDATARLLAPRRSLLSNILPKVGEKPPKKEGKKKPSSKDKDKPAKDEPKKGKPSQPEQRSKKPQKPLKAKQEVPQKAASAPRQKKKGSSGQKRYDRPRGMPPEPPRKNQPKDSTEQASLMKPYYLEIDR